MSALVKLRPQLAILRQLIKDVAREQVQKDLFWVEAEPDELAAYLVMRDFAEKIGLQNPATQLAGIGVFGSDLPMAQLEANAEPLLASLRGDPAVWNGVQRASESFLTPQRVAKVQGLLGNQQPSALADVCPAILQRVLISRLAEFLKQPSLANLSWVAAFRTHPILESRELSDRGRQSQAAVKLALAVEKVERHLAEFAPEFANADALLDWFIHHQLAAIHDGQSFALYTVAREVGRGALFLSRTSRAWWSRGARSQSCPMGYRRTTLSRLSVR